ncbi:hypothetical protein BC628DRAFT_1364926 [Trametes gibbosa]|nr:hypothetical protein BC628DRAFT_1386502 [Trametes gibbosa]KAI0828253.1 hypothetical protein BC628DRAFT_1364926 [Trametes gibbosa]
MASGLPDAIETSESTLVAPPAHAYSPHGLHALPVELVERILICSDPRDISRYAQTCRFARSLVYDPNDQFLCRELYLSRPFDDLRQALPLPKSRLEAPRASTAASASPALTNNNASSSTSQSWLYELQRRIEAEAIATAGGRASVPALHRMFETFLAAVDTALPVREEGDGLPQNPRTPGSHSENLRWLDRVLRRTKVLNLPVPPETCTPSADTTATASVPTSTASAPASPTASCSRRELRPSKPPLQPTPSSEDTLVAETRQLRCRLRAYVALSHESSFVAESRERVAALRKASRCFVYDMRRYQPETLWGPYRVVSAPAIVSGTTAEGDGRGATVDTEGGLAVEGSADGTPSPAPRRLLVVNWEHVEHILNVVGLKLREVPQSSLGFYKKPLFMPEALRAYSAVGARESAERPVHDWAGVTGKWRRFVCFMDYRDLYMFNYSHLPPGPHHPSFFEDPFDEALRPVELHLSLIRESEYFADARYLPRAPPSCSVGDDGEDVQDKRFPTLYFEGHSRAP